MVLADSSMGEFTVKHLVNETCETVKAELKDFFKNRKPDDMILLYICGLAIKDEADGIYFIVADSARENLESSITARYLRDLIRSTPARLQLVVFDCRYAGVFPEGGVEDDAKLGPMAGLSGEGRFALSSTNQLTWAWEKFAPGDPVAVRDPNPWLLDDFTKALKTGLADLDQNRVITIRELADYLVQASTEARPDLPNDGRPSRWAWDKSKEDEVVIGKAALPEEDKEPTGRRERFDLAQVIRRPILELISPSYILDSHYFLLDWNDAFDEVVAKPLRLARGIMHVGVFIRSLKNSEEVVHQPVSARRDGRHRGDGLRYLGVRVAWPGLLSQDRFAQIVKQHRQTLGWSVNLNVKSVEHDEPGFWKAILDRIESQVGWSSYAAVYDQLLLEFREYGKLVELVASSQVGDPYRCRAPQAAAAGNGSLRLLENDQIQEVWAVEINETMLNRFREKLVNSKVKDSERLTIFKDNVARLDGFPPSTFDAAIMMNVLYAIDDRRECLRNINRILKVGGILSLSTSYRETDVKRLFDAMEAGLKKKGLLDRYREAIGVAWIRHERMMPMILRDTIQDTVHMIEEAGFELEGGPVKSYVDAVIVIKARRPLDPTLPASTRSDIAVTAKRRNRTPPPGQCRRDVFLDAIAADLGAWSRPRHRAVAREGGGLLRRPPPRRAFDD